MAKSKKVFDAWGAMHGTTSLGERGQVVIPKKLRDSLKMKRGDSFIVMEKGGAIVLLPVQLMESFISGISSHIKKIKK